MQLKREPGQSRDNEIEGISVGGGGIAPMRQRWEQALGAIEQEAPKIKAAANGASERIEAEPRN